MRRCVIVGGALIADYPAIRSYLRKEDYYIFCDSGMKHQKALGVEPDLIVGDFDSWNADQLPEAKPGMLNTELNFHEVRMADISGSPLQEIASRVQGEESPSLQLSDASLDPAPVQKNCNTVSTKSVLTSQNSAPARMSKTVHAEVLLLPHDKYDTDTVYGVREGIARGFEEFLLIGVIGQRMDHTLGNLYILTMLESAGKHGVLVDDYSDMELVSERPGYIDDRYLGFSLLNITGIARGVTIEDARYCFLPGGEIPYDYQYALSNEVLPGKTAKVTVSEGNLLLIRNRRDS